MQSLLSHRQLFCLATATATIVAIGLLLPTQLNADVLPPGHRSVTHELVFESSDELAGTTLVAAPIAGLNGVKQIKVGEPFRFSSKYGTKFYVIQDNFSGLSTIPKKFNKSSFGFYPNASPPISEIKSVPLISSIHSAKTTLRLTGFTVDGAPSIEIVEHIELDRFGYPASYKMSWLLVGLPVLCGLGICFYLIKRRVDRKLAQTTAVHETHTARKQPVAEEPTLEP